MQKHRTARLHALARVTVLALGAAALTQLPLSALAASATAGTDVHAPAAGTTPNELTPSEQWSTLQSQLVLLRTKAEIARLRAEIRTADSAAGSPASVPMGQVGQAGQPTAAVPGPEPRVVRDSVHLVSVDAYNGQYGALLDVDGRSVPVREHDVIAGGWTVVHITGTTVELSKGAQTRVVRL